MNETNINKKVIQWLSTCPNVDWLFALFGEVSDGAQHLTRLSDNTIQKYIDGGSKKYSDFILNCFNSVSYFWQPPENSENLTEYDNAQEICDWIETQNENNNFPDLENCTVYSVVPIPTNPQIAGVDENQLVKYAVGFRITYTIW